jgi:hypothetical protein
MFQNHIQQNAAECCESAKEIGLRVTGASMRLTATFTTIGSLGKILEEYRRAVSQLHQLSEGIQILLLLGAMAVQILWKEFVARTLIVGLDATTKGPSPLVGESKVSCSENNYFTFIRSLHTNN